MAEEEREGGRRVGSRVTGMQCRISPRPSEERARRRRERNVVYREEWKNTTLKVCTHTRVARMLRLHPSHESKLFETEKEIWNYARERGQKGDRLTLKGIGRERKKYKKGR